MNDTYTDADWLLPLLPEVGMPGTAGLLELAAILRQADAALASTFTPAVRAAIVPLVEVMNSYYTNTIEGQYTFPLEVEAALRSAEGTQPQTEPHSKALLARAIIQTEREFVWRAAKLDWEACLRGDFILELHRHLYAQLPESARVISDPDSVTNGLLRPGELRAHAVKVGAHIPPRPEALPVFLTKFSHGYSPMMLPTHGLSREIWMLVAAMAAHHRLSWIHPFADGNGRVSRMHTTALLQAAGLESMGLWAWARGLSRDRDGYYNALKAADRHRAGELDGRGSLSHAGLVAWVEFALQTALDQIQFMRELLAPESFMERFEHLIQRLEGQKRIRHNPRPLFDAIIAGRRVSRTDAEKLLGLSDRTAKHTLDELMALDLLGLRNVARGAPLSLRFGQRHAPFLFPDLYPPSIESKLMQASQE
jgi:Fic family protein